MPSRAGGGRADARVSVPSRRRIAAPASSRARGGRDRVLADRSPVRVASIETRVRVAVTRRRPGIEAPDSAPRAETAETCDPAAACAGLPLVQATAPRRRSNAARADIARSGRAPTHEMVYEFFDYKTRARCATGVGWRASTRRRSLDRQRRQTRCRARPKTKRIEQPAVGKSREMEDLDCPRFHWSGVEHADEMTILAHTADDKMFAVSASPVAPLRAGARPTRRAHPPPRARSSPRRRPSPWRPRRARSFRRTRA